jgi:hypothetical protein
MEVPWAKFMPKARITMPLVRKPKRPVKTQLNEVIMVKI